MIDQFAIDREELTSTRRQLTVKEREFNLLEAQSKLRQESALLNSVRLERERESETRTESKAT